MIIRDGNSTEQWERLRRALGKREARFVVRESLPTASIVWAPESLPNVLLSRDLYDFVCGLVPTTFARNVLAPIRRRGAR